MQWAWGEGNAATRSALCILQPFCIAALARQGCRVRLCNTGSSPCRLRQSRAHGAERAPRLTEQTPNGGDARVGELRHSEQRERFFVKLTDQFWCQCSVSWYAKRKNNAVQINKMSNTTLSVTRVPSGRYKQRRARRRAKQRLQLAGTRSKRRWYGELGGVVVADRSCCTFRS